MKPLDPRLLRYARASRAYLAATVALGVAQAGLIVGQAALLAHGISAVFLDRLDLDGLTPTLIALAGVTAGRAAIGWLQEAAAARSSAAVKDELRGRLFAQAVALGPGRLTGAVRTGEMTALVTRGLDALDAYFARYLPQLVLAALIPAVVLARLLPADLVATVTIMLTLPLIPVFLALVGRHTESANRRQFRLLARLGLETAVGEHGMELSGGERRRLALARALLAGFEVLILDEPTEHLDDDTAAALTRDLLAAAGDRTVLLITHRPGTAAELDRVITLGHAPAVSAKGAPTGEPWPKPNYYRGSSYDVSREGSGCPPPSASLKRAPRRREHC